MYTQDELLRMYMDGYSIAEIAQELDVSREALYQRLRREDDWDYIKVHASKKRAEKRRLELQEKARDIVEGWIAGVSMDDLAKEFEVPRTAISWIIDGEMGTTKRNYSRDLKIVEDYKGGATQRDLADKYGISQPCISRIVNALVEE